MTPSEQPAMRDARTLLRQRRSNTSAPESKSASASPSAARRRSAEHEADGERRRSQTSIEKALAVLGAFDGPYHGRGITELVRDLGISRPTLHRILKQLEDGGFVRQLPSKRYQIGIRLFELGSRVSDQVQLRVPAIPHLHSLYNRIGCTVYLSVWAGDAVLHLDCLPGHSDPPLPSRAGGRWPAHCAASGKVLLAHAPADVITRYLSQPLRAVTSKTITDHGEFRLHLQEVRAQGYATTVEESLVGIWGVAAPIRDRRNKVVASVCIAGRSRSFLNRREDVIDTANAIGHDISTRTALDGGLGRWL